MELSSGKGFTESSKALTSEKLQSNKSPKYENRQKQPRKQILCFGPSPYKPLKTNEVKPLVTMNGIKIIKSSLSIDFFSGYKSTLPKKGKNSMKFIINIEPYCF